MKLVILEPLGIADEKLVAMAQEACGDQMELVYYYQIDLYQQISNNYQQM